MITAPLLAFDTSTPTARVAVLAPDGRPLAQAEKVVARHSSNLLRLCDETMREAALSGVAALGAIGCGAGPGSFTGLRVGLAIAKGLAMPSDLPLVLISSLEALARDLAAASTAARVIVPCIDAGKDQVYARVFARSGGSLEAQGDEWAVTAAELAGRLAERPEWTRALAIGGTGVERYRETFAQALGAAAVVDGAVGPTALAVGALALARLGRGERDDLARAVPSYGRPPDITRPKRPPPGANRGP